MLGAHSADVTRSFVFYIEPGSTAVTMNNNISAWTLLVTDNFSISVPLGHPWSFNFKYVLTRYPHCQCVLYGMSAHYLQKSSDFFDVILFSYIGNQASCDCGIEF